MVVEFIIQKVSAEVSPYSEIQKKKSLTTYT